MIFKKPQWISIFLGMKYYFVFSFYGIDVLKVYNSPFLAKHPFQGVVIINMSSHPIHTATVVASLLN